MRASQRVTRFLEAALAELPRAYADRLSNVEFVLARRPSRYERVRTGRRGTLYGLYEGVPLPHRGTGYGAGSYHFVPPDKITVYWEALVRDFPEDAALADQVRKTVYHEIAHHFGISDAELRRTSVE